MKPVISERFDELGRGAKAEEVRLGIMGGTFDPVHFGHLLCAEDARDILGLDAVIFMPAGVPSFKRDAQIASVEHRVNMLRLATCDNPAFDVSLLEVERSGVTYTVDTLRTLKAYYPSNVHLYFITGADSIRDLPCWYGAEELASLATFVGVARPGYDLESARRACEKGGLGFDIVYLRIESLAISSTDVRRRVNQGSTIRYRTPVAVCSYIQEHHLYQE